MRLEHHVVVERLLDPEARARLLEALLALEPLWEDRYPPGRPTRRGQSQRRLLRPVYWLGGWQFACLRYYCPPDGVTDRVMRAEPFPPEVAEVAVRAERLARQRLPAALIPEGWRLNTCLVNYYGWTLRDGEWIDAARVSEHRDHEPGPVASFSLGARALFQFIDGPRDRPGRSLVEEVWLKDGSLQLFAGEQLKRELFHRVPSVARGAPELPLGLEGFRCRRINLTFRFVPEEALQTFSELSEAARSEVRPYVETLAGRSDFFSRALEASARDQRPGQTTSTGSWSPSSRR